MESRPCRPQRNRRHSRRAWPPEDDIHHPRPAKRLFTPEIKRMLKDWLIRRRENPYPSRDEKKRLAIETGLTYTQICNWFANWRRKLKNSERERAKKSWGHLIKHYNTNAKGNVEQFSISSEDSIWEEEENLRVDLRTDEEDEGDYSESDTEMDAYEQNESVETAPYFRALHASKFYMEAVQMEHSNYYPGDSAVNTTAQCYQVSSTTPEYGAEQMLSAKNPNEAGAVQQPRLQQQQQQQTFSPNKAKYKQLMMEKYLRDTSECNSEKVATLTAPGAGAELSKWLESAAKFTPNKNNYFIEWNRKKNKLEKRQRPKQAHRVVVMPGFAGETHQQNESQLHVHNQENIYESIHHKDELDAAEALANLAFNCRQRMLDANVYPAHSINAIPSA